MKKENIGFNGKEYSLIPIGKVLPYYDYQFLTSWNQMQICGFGNIRNVRNFCRGMERILTPKSNSKLSTVVKDSNKQMKQDIGLCAIYLNALLKEKIINKPFFINDRSGCFQGGDELVISLLCMDEKTIDGDWALCTMKYPGGRGYIVCDAGLPLKKYPEEDKPNEIVLSSDSLVVMNKWEFDYLRKTIAEHGLQSYKDLMNSAIDHEDVHFLKLWFASVTKQEKPKIPEFFKTLVDPVFAEGSLQEN